MWNDVLYGSTYDWYASTMNRKRSSSEPIDPAIEEFARVLVEAAASIIEQA
jgi:hypothetical protein